MSIIYGIDTSKPVTPFNARDCLITCFTSAHGGAAQLSESDDVKNQYIENIVKKFFIEVGGDFDHPTKESLIKVLEKLKEFSLNFRSAELVEQHVQEIMTLINLIP